MLFAAAAAAGRYFSADRSFAFQGIKNEIYYQGKKRKGLLDEGRICLGMAVT